MTKFTRIIPVTAVLLLVITLTAISGLGYQMLQQSFPIIIVFGPGFLMFLTHPITEWILNHNYTYQAQLNNMTNASFSLIAPPSWLNITGGGLVYGTPFGFDTGGFNVSIQAANGVNTVWQNYTLMVSAYSQLDWTIMIGLVLFIVLLAIGYAKEEPFLVLSGGSIGFVLGLYLIVTFGMGMWWLGIILVIVGFTFVATGAIEVGER